MPIFEYHCKKCGNDFEKIHLSRESAASVACPSCESDRIVKKLSTFGVAGGSKGDDFGGFGGDDGGGDGGDDGGDDGMDAGPTCGRCGSSNPCGADSN